MFISISYSSVWAQEYMNNKLVEQFGHLAHKCYETYRAKTRHKFGGKNAMTYNIHGMQHCFDDTRKFGSFKNYSAFEYEDMMGRIKSFVKRPGIEIQQCVKRLHEINLWLAPSRNQEIYPKLKKKHSNGQYKHVILEQYELLTTTAADNTIMVADNVYIITNILYEKPKVTLLCRKYLEKNNFFSYPIHSSELQIFEVHNLQDQPTEVPIENVPCKCMRLPFGNKHVTFPLIHTK